MIDIPPRPAAIALFEKLAFCQIFLAVTRPAWHNSEAQQGIAEMGQSYWVFLALGLAVVSALILLIARQRKNWARWLWVVMSALSLGLLLNPMLLTGQASPPFHVLIIALADFTIGLVSAGLLLMPQSSAWFEGGK